MSRRVDIAELRADVDAVVARVASALLVEDVSLLASYGPGRA